MVLTIRSAAIRSSQPAWSAGRAAIFLVGSLLAFRRDGAFALSLFWRAREIGLAVPALIAWQVIEARRLLRTRAAVERLKS